MNNHIPYTYLLKFTNPTSGETLFYYGVRYAIHAHPDELFKTYFSSSKIVNKLIKKYGVNCFQFEIRKTFPNNPAKAHLWEQKVLIRLNAAKRNDFLNQSVGGKVFVMMGENNPAKRKEVGEKISKALTGLMIGSKNPFYGRHHTDETKKKISNKNKGHKLSKETKKKMSKAHKGKKDSLETRRKKSVAFSGNNNPMYGRKGCADHLNKVRAQCVYCGIEANIGNIKRWHMDNCKKK